MKIFGGMNNSKLAIKRGTSALGTINNIPTAVVDKVRKLFKNVTGKRAASFGLAAILTATLATAHMPKAKADGNPTTSIEQNAALDQSLTEQLMESGQFVNDSDVLALTFLANIDNASEFVNQYGFLPSDFDGLDLEANTYDDILVKADRVNDAIRNTMLDPEVPSVSYTSVLLNADENHVELIKRGEELCSEITCLVTDSWLNGTDPTLNEELNNKVSAFFNLTRQARTYLTTGEYTLWLGLVKSVAAPILLDENMQQMWAETLNALGTSVDFKIVETELGLALETTDGRSAILTENVRAALGYSQRPCTR